MPLADPSEAEADLVTEPAITSAFVPESSANPMADLPTPEFPQAYYEQDSQLTSYTTTSALKEAILSAEPAAADTLAGDPPSRGKAAAAPASLGQRLSRRFQSLWRFGKPQAQVITRLEHCPKCHSEHLKPPSDHSASE